MPVAPPKSRPGSLLPLGIVVLLAIGGLFFLLARNGWDSKNPPSSASDSLSARRPLALERLAERPGGDLVLEAIEASGGWDAWQSHKAVRFRLTGVFFAENGAVGEQRTEDVTMMLASPTRIRIEAADSSTVMGFGKAGAWGAGRQTDGRWNPAMGPGALPKEELRNLTLEAAWVFGLPFNLGDSDARFMRAGVQQLGDSLTSLEVTYAPAPGDTLGRQAHFGFDKDSGHILQVAFTEKGRFPDHPALDYGPPPNTDPGMEPAKGVFFLTLRGYTDFGGVWRPTRRVLWESPEFGTTIKVYEQRLTDVVWDPAVNDAMFEPPPAP